MVWGGAATGDCSATLKSAQMRNYPKHVAADRVLSLAVQLSIVGINVLAGGRFVGKTNGVSHRLYPFGSGPETVKVKASRKAVSKSTGIVGFPQIPPNYPIAVSILMHMNCHALIVTDLPLTVTPAPGQLGTGYFTHRPCCPPEYGARIRSRCVGAWTCDH